MVQCHIPPTKICVVFVVRYVVQTMKFHAKPGKRFFLVRIIRHIQMVLRQKVRVERHALIGFYRALLALTCVISTHFNNRHPDSD